MSILTKSEISKLIEAKPPLIEGYLSLAEQLQPNGIDLTLRDVARLKTAGQVTVDNKNRKVSELEPLPFDSGGFMTLTPGCYMITYNEIVSLPPDIMALGQPRSSLLRCGVGIGTAAWDAGYSGRSQSLLTVHNPLGFRVERNARVLQLVFLRLSNKTEGYKGSYQDENKGL